MPAVHSFSEVVLYPMLALSLRTSVDFPIKGGATTDIDLDALADTAWSLLSTRYAAFDIDEDFFEGLCLLAQVHFASKS